MTDLIIAPTEPAQLRALGTTSLTPEHFGADIFFPSPTVGPVGIQRKVFPDDFLASIYDGRFAELVAKMKQLSVRVLLLEGHGTWATNGQLIVDHGRQKWSRSQHRAFLWSVKLEGIWVEQTDDIDETIAWLVAFRAWCEKDHKALRTRPGPKGALGVGRADTRDWQRHLLQGFPGVVPDRADAIIDHFGGVPLRWDDVELEDVPGVGKKTAERMKGMLGG